MAMNDKTLAVSENREALTLRQIVEALGARGVEIGYTTLSEMVGTEDIAEQLGVSGGGNKKAFPPAAVEVLATFLPAYRSAKGKLPQAPGMLRAFLGRAMAGGASTSSTAITEFRRNSETVSIEMAEAQGRAQGLAAGERVLTAQEAAEYLRISKRLLRKSVPPWKRFGSAPGGDRWLLSEIVSR